MSERSERRLVLVLAAVQFVNILDFMMVMPLGPDFADQLSIDRANLGIIGGSYTASAALSGFACAFFLDRFDRRPALALSLLGLAVGTFGGVLATGLGSLVLARVIAGAFGGPATSLAMSIVADAIPPERRGRAMGTMMTAFSVASVAGVPAGLELARLGTWHTPFIATAALAVVAALLAQLMLPPLRGHLESAHHDESAFAGFARLFTRPVTAISYAMTFTTMLGMFALIPNIAAYIQGNLGYPRESLGMLYGAGGLASFITMRPFGRMVDRFGALRVGTVASVLTAVIVWVGFGQEDFVAPVLGVFVCFMVANGLRNVAYNTLTSRVPEADERARFMSLQSMVQHVGAAAGAFLSSQLLSTTDDGLLVGLPHVAWVAVLTMAALPFFMATVQARLAPAHTPAPAAAPGE